VLLPRSWLKGVLDRLDVERAKAQGCRFRRLLQPVAHLIHSLHPPADSGMLKQQPFPFLVTDTISDRYQGHIPICGRPRIS
jgi:hypothetical protein